MNKGYRSILANANDRRHARAVARERRDAQPAEQNNEGKKSRKLVLLEAHFQVEHARRELEKVQAALASLPPAGLCDLSELIAADIGLALLALAQTREPLDLAIKQEAKE